MPKKENSSDPSSKSDGALAVMVPSFNDVKMYFFDISEVFDGQVGTQIKEGKIKVYANIIMAYRFRDWYY